LKISPKTIWALAVAAIFLAAHLAFLPPTLEDLDSMNFALGVRDFDLTKHQPHAPGYPVFIALGKLSRAIWPSEAGSLSWWSALFGALSVFPLLLLYRSFEALDRSADDADRDRRAALATMVTIASPLFWFTSLRPLSDMTGLAFALTSQACLAAAFVRRRAQPNPDATTIAESGRLIVAGAFIAGLAVGVRTQMVWLTVPLLAFVLVDRAGRGAAGAILGSAMTFSIGVLLWAIPLLIAAGGFDGYRAAFAELANDQLYGGLNTLLNNPSPRRLALGIFASLVGPWAWPPLGWLVVAVGFAALVLLWWRAPRGALLLMVAFMPYAAFHIIVQETYSRYALPVVPAIGYLVVRGLSAGGIAIVTLGTAAIVIVSLAVTLPAARAYSEHPSPAYAAVEDLQQILSTEPGVIGAHQRFARVLETREFESTKVLPSPVMSESRELAAYWLGAGTAPVWYFADPARGDLDLVDPLSVRVHRHYNWKFPRDLFISGVRPDVVDLVRIDSPPGWFAETGWHLTSETLNISEREGRSEAIARVRRRTEPAVLVVGAESTERAGGKPARVSVMIDDRPVGEWDVPAGGRFFKRVTLEPGVLSGESAFSRLVASYKGADGRPEPVRLTQFMVASPLAQFFIPHAGWNEREYNDQLQRRWRWTTGRAEIFVNAAGRDVTLTLAGESPLRYFDAAPRVTIRAGSQVLATAQPSSDFDLRVKVPAATLAASDGMITIETDKTFVPHERSGSPDRRTLGLRIFDLRVE
jgi:hypothetical protein